MTVTPTGPLGGPLAYFRGLLAASATFQTWTGAADATAALAFIALGDADPSSYPFAIIAHEGGGAAKRFDSPGAQFVPDAGEVSILLADADNSGLSDADNYATFLNNVGAVIDEVCAASNGASAYPAMRWDIDDAMRSEDTRGLTAGGAHFKLWIAESRIAWEV